MEKDMKLKQARDVILAYLMKEDFTVEECYKVFELCFSEIDASVQRTKFVEIKKDGEE